MSEERDLEFSTTELAEICGCDRQAILHHCRGGVLRSEKRNSSRIVLMTEDEFAKYKAYHWERNDSESISISCDLLQLRDSTIARREEVVLAALFQAFAAAQITERPVIKWHDLMSACVTIGIAPRSDVDKWLKNLVKESSSGKNPWFDVFWVKPERTITDRAAKMKKICAKNAQSPDGWLNLNETAKKTGIGKSTLSTWCVKGLIPRARRMNDRKNKPWIIPEEWEPPEDFVACQPFQSSPRVNRGPRL